MKYIVGFFKFIYKLAEVVVKMTVVAMLFVLFLESMLPLLIDTSPPAVVTIILLSIIIYAIGWNIKNNYFLFNVKEESK